MSVAVPIFRASVAKGETAVPKAQKVRPVERAEVEALLARVDSGQLQDGDLSILGLVLRSWLQLSVLIERAHTSIARLRRLLFGPAADRRAAPPDPTQPDPETRPPAAAPDGAPSTASTPTASAKRRSGHGRRPASAYTGARRVRCPTTEVRPGDRCPACFERGRLYDTNEPALLLKFTGQPIIAATVFEQQTLRCSSCLERYCAPLLDGVTADRWDPSADVAIAVYKYVACLPWYRMQKLQAAVGVPLPASVQWERSEHVADVFLPVFLELERIGAMLGTFYVDDTGVKILDLLQENKLLADTERRGMFTSGIVAKGAVRQVVLYYSGRRHAGENLARILELRPAGMRPPIEMGDALSSNWPPGFSLVVAKCLAHARREFVNLEAAFPAECGRVLDDLALIYRVDAETAEMSAADRLAHHQAKSTPIFEALHEWIEQQFSARRVEPNSSLGGALTYLLKHWRGLTQATRVVGAPLDNNIVERALKIAVLHRKNALFYKTQHGADCGDLIQSVAETCRLNQVDVWGYLLDVMRNPRAVRANAQAWLPWTWAERNRASDAKAA